MAEFEKINIYVPRDLALSLERDAMLFEIFKKDNHTINRNRFLSMLIIGYAQTYAQERSDAFQRILHIAGDYVKDVRLRSDLSRRLLEQVLYPDQPKEKGSHPVTLSLKPTRETELLLQEIYQLPSQEGSISQYLCKMFSEYRKKPLPERERIIFHDTYDFLQDAVARKKSIIFISSSAPGVLQHVLPYALSSGPEEMFNYLLCQQMNEKTNTIEARTYRIGRIQELRYSGTQIIADPSVSRYLKQMKDTHPQYAIRNSETAEVVLTEVGLASYNKIYHGRPSYDSLEVSDSGYRMRFNCSEDQLFLYFKRFEPGEAIVLAPESLRNRLMHFLKNGYEAYLKSSGSSSG